MLNRVPTCHKLFVMFLIRLRNRDGIYRPFKRKIESSVKKAQAALLVLKILQRTIKMRVKRRNFVVVRLCVWIETTTCKFKSEELCRVNVNWTSRLIHQALPRRNRPKAFPWRERQWSWSHSYSRREWNVRSRDVTLLPSPTGIHSNKWFGNLFTFRVSELFAKAGTSDNILPTLARFLRSISYKTKSSGKNEKKF